MRTYRLQYLTMNHINQIEDLWIPGKDTFNEKEIFTLSLNKQQLTELLYITSDRTYEEAEDEVINGYEVAFSLFRKQKLEITYKLV